MVSQIQTIDIAVEVSGQLLGNGVVVGLVTKQTVHEHQWRSSGIGNLLDIPGQLNSFGGLVGRSMSHKRSFRGDGRGEGPTGDWAESRHAQGTR